MKKIVFLGGDKRELMVMQRMLHAGWSVLAYAVPEAALPAGVQSVKSAAAALQDADACILPLPPFHKDGRLYSMCDPPVYLDDDVFALAQPGMPLITGIVTDHLQCIAPRCVCVGMLDSDELAIPLAEATAEGAVAEAIRLSDGLMCGQQALLIGYGRIGRALAWRLEALGMEVTVINRGLVRANEARDKGCTVGEWSQLTALAAQADYIFNTVPAAVLGREQLQWIGHNAVVIDLAASPGGTDFIAAAELGIKAVLAGGLPGRYTPRYAGEVMANAYLHRLSLLLEGEDEYE